jgi:predicted nucleic acid-binding protein
MNCVDSSGWLEFFAGGPNSDAFAPPIRDGRRLVVPSLCVFEVFKRIAQQRGEQAALAGAGLMLQARIQDLDARLAIAAAKLSIDLKLALADSVVLATAQLHRATLWTQDADFESMPDVRYIPRR